MKKIFTLITIFTIYVGCAMAQITGDYDGDFTVNSDSYEKTVTLVQTGTTYTIRIPNLIFGNGAIVVGDVDLTEVNAEETVSGYILSSSNTVNITISGIPVAISLASGQIDSRGDLTFSLNISNLPITADFDGTKRATEAETASLSDVKGQTISISPTVLTESKAIKVKGLESAQYTIYTASGYVAKAGFFEEGKISIIELSAGSYIVSIEGQMNRFYIR